MKVLRKEIDEKGHIILICERKILGVIKKKESYVATREYVKGYWNWRKLPDKRIVHDHLSFQLNEWCKDFDI